MNLAKRNSEAAKAWAAKRRESKERALLHERSRSSSSSSNMATRPANREEPMPPKYAASTSHEANGAYMEDFRVGMANLYLALEGPAEATGHDHVSQGRGSLAAPSSAGQRVIRASRQPSLGDMRASDRTNRSHRRSHREVVGDGSCPGARSQAISLAGVLKKDTADGMANGWHEGPLDPAGHLVDLSDRNLLCASVFGEEAVFGCADHALYSIDLSRGIKMRQLYGSRSKPDAGHKEWVSSVCHTPSGDIVSGGMDGKLCLWPRRGGAPGEVQAHAGSISAMKVDAEGRVVTSGYGGALRVWDCRGRAGAPRLCGELSDRGLPAPCMDFAWCGNRMMTGHRDGRLGVYDLETGALLSGGGGGGAHRGHVTTVNTLADAEGGGGSGCFVTGGQDGFVRVWDPRARELEERATGRGEGGGSVAVMEAPAHRGVTGVGAVGGVITAGGGHNRLASFGADRRVCILEMRGGRQGSGGSGGGSGSRANRWEGRSSSSSLTIEHVFDHHRDFIYCMDFVHAGSDATMAGGTGEGVLVTGGGDGMLLAHDLGRMRLLYGLGCCREGAVRCAVAQEGRLVVGGDDGNAVLYRFDGARNETKQGSSY